MKLSQNFLWGAATSAYQVEGNNYATDWWEFERAPGAPVDEICGDSTDHYHRYREDISLLADLGFNAFRFGIEWSRIQPEKGEISRAGLDHYRDVLLACKERGITPLVTFLHHTLPRWVSREGGWLWDESSRYFAEYCDIVTREMNGLIPLAMTINQPDLDANIGYRWGKTYPGWIAGRSMSGDEAAERVSPNLISAHRRGREAIKANLQNVQVGLGIAVTPWIFDGPEEELLKHRAVRNWEGDYYSATEGDDFLGVQSYTRGVAVAPDGNPDAPVGKNGHPCPPGTRLTKMGYEYFPEAIGLAVRRGVKKTGLPIIVTENGLGTDSDSERVEFIGRALRSLRECLEDGLDLRGYFHWSLLDNFEWNSGYSMKFGLVEVDRQTFARTQKPSAAYLGNFAQRNELP